MNNDYLPNTITTPSALKITAITNAYPAVVTTQANPVIQVNVYQIGMLVRFFVPITYGMWQIDNKVLKVLDVVGNNITVDVDTRNFDVFSVPVSDENTPASLSPNGSNNLTLDNTTKNVPFRSYNNIGN